MAKTFTITTTATDTLKADAKGHAEAAFTVTNTSARPVRGMAKATALDSAKGEWLKISGDTERDFPSGGTQQIVVTFDAPVTAPAAGSSPTGAAADKYSFRLDVASATNPDEDFTEGPVVKVELPTPQPVAPKKPFPKWIFIPIAAVVLIGIALGLYFALRGDKKVAIPNVVGMTLEDAKTALTSAKLTPVEKEVQITGKSPAGQVIDQDPKADSPEVAANTEVMLITEGEEALVEVPDVKQRLIADATARLTEKGFSVVQKGQEVSEGLQPNQVVSQTPEGGSKAKGGSTVELVVATQKLVTVPDVVFKPLNVAIPQLTIVTLKFVQKDPELAPANVAPGNIKRQNPAAGTRVPPGSTIELVLAATPVTVPDVTKKTVGAAQLTLQGSKLDLGSVSGTLDQSNVNSALINSQSPAANTQVAQGSKVNVSVPVVCRDRRCLKPQYYDMKTLQGLDPRIRPRF